MTSVLEKYHNRGWLDFGNAAYSGDDRLRTGIRFAQDFYDSHIYTAGIVDLSKVRVDCSSRGDVSPKVWDARKRYVKALRAIPGDVVNIVCSVCCFDKDLKIEKVTIPQYRHDLEVVKYSVCTGLDALIEHYNGKLYVRRQKITGFTEVNIWDYLECG